MNWYPDTNECGTETVSTDICCLSMSEYLFANTYIQTLRQPVTPPPTLLSIYLPCNPPHNHCIVMCTRQQMGPVVRKAQN